MESTVYIYIVCVWGWVFKHTPLQSRCSAVAMETSRWVLLSVVFLQQLDDPVSLSFVRGVCAGSVCFEFLACL